jgi:hypothetical protein
MKKLSLLSLLLPAVMITSCSDDEQTAATNPDPVGIGAKYSLINVSGSIAGVSNNFEPGTITWQFNEENNTVTVVNNFDDNNGMVEDFFTSGTYSFIQVEGGSPSNTCQTTFEADGIELGCFSEAEDGTIIFNQQYADGYALTLKPVAD